MVRFAPPPLDWQVYFLRHYPHTRLGMYSTLLSYLSCYLRVRTFLKNRKYFCNPRFICYLQIPKMAGTGFEPVTLRL